jgi:D-alanine transaminase
MTEVYLNGAFMPLSEARVPVLDRGFLFGDGVYEVIPAYQGVPLRLDAHLARLEYSLSGIRLDNPLSRTEWRRIFTRLLGANPEPRQALYLQVTRGAPASRDHRFPVLTAPTVFVMVKPVAARDPRINEHGVAAVLREDSRWQRCDLKTISLVAAVLLQQEATEQAAEEALLMRAGQVVEGSTSNLFVLDQGQLRTPPLGPELLAGITRGLVIDLAEAEGMSVSEGPISLASCRAAEELWICSSTRELLPVTQLDGAPVGDGRPGALWRRLDAAYHAYVQRLVAGDADG